MDGVDYIANVPVENTGSLDPFGIPASVFTLDDELCASDAEQLLMFCQAQIKSMSELNVYFQVGINVPFYFPDGDKWDGVSVTLHLAENKPGKPVRCWLKAINVFDDGDIIESVFFNLDDLYTYVLGKEKRIGAGIA